MPLQVGDKVRVIEPKVSNDDWNDLYEYIGFVGVINKIDPLPGVEDFQYAFQDSGPFFYSNELEVVTE